MLIIQIMKATVEYCMWNELENPAPIGTNDEQWECCLLSSYCFLFRCVSHCTIIVLFIADGCCLVEHGAHTQNVLYDIYMFSWHELGLQLISRLLVVTGVIHV